MAKVNVRDRNKNNPNKKPNWEYRFEAAKINGKRQSISKAGFRTKKEALDAGTKALAEYNNSGLHFEPSEISFSDYIDYWYKEYCIVNLKYSTMVSYGTIIETRLKPHFGIYKLKSLNPSVLQEYANLLCQKGFSSNYINGILHLLNNALDYAVYPLQYIKDNPMRYVRYPKNAKPQRTRSVISVEDLNKILERFPRGTRLYVPVLLGWFCGLRISEALALTWDDVDFDKKTIIINKQLVKRNVDVNYDAGEKSCRTGICSLYFGTPKYNSYRTIKMGGCLTEILKEELEIQRKNEERYQDLYTIYGLKEEIDEKGRTVQRICKHLNDGSSSLPRLNFVCIIENGTLTTQDQMPYYSDVINRELKIEYSFHALRHTHATTLIEGGVSPKAVQQRLGHKNVNTTLQVYVKVTEAMQDEAADVFEESSALAIKSLGDKSPR